MGNPETIGLRTGLFFLMLLLSVAALVLAAVAARRLSARYGTWNAMLIAGAAFIIVIGIVQLALPEINEVPEKFPAVVLWHFRVASLGIQAVLWTTIVFCSAHLPNAASRIGSVNEYPCEPHRASFHGRALRGSHLGHRSMLQVPAAGLEET